MCFPPIEWNHNGNKNYLRIKFGAAPYRKINMNMHTFEGIYEYISADKYKYIVAYGKLLAASKFCEFSLAAAAANLAQSILRLIQNILIAHALANE